MKIAFVYDTVYPETKGGVEKRVWELARRLVRRGHEVHLLVPHAWAGPPTIERDGVILRGVSRRRDLYTRKGRRAVWPAVVHAVGVHRLLRHEHFDLVDCQIPAHLAALASRAAVRDRADVRQVITWHEVWENSWMDEMGILLGHIGRVVERWVARIPAVHTAVSAQNAESLARLGRKVDDVIHPGVDLVDHEVSDEAESDILFVGRLVPTKNVGLLIRATARLSSNGLSPRVLIVGGGPSKDGWERLTQDLGLGDLVTFSGPIEDESRLMATLGSTRVLALPSIREGFGMIALEAAALGVPVVTVDHERNAARHLIDHGVTGLRVPPDPALFADALQAILNDEERRLQLSRAAFESARHATWDSAVDRTEAQYRVATAQPLSSARRGVAGNVNPFRPSPVVLDANRAHAGEWPDIDGFKFLGFCDHFQLPMIGGSERVTLEVYTAMRERGADVSVLTSLPGATSQWASVNGTPTWAHPMLDLTDAINLQVGVSPGLLRMSLAIVKDLNPRVLHASSIHFQSARVAASTARRTGIPLVTTAHVGSIEHLPLLPRVATDLYERSFGARILNASTKVIAVSKSVAEHVIALGTPSENVVVVPNGVDTERFRPIEGGRADQIAFVGRLVGNKRPDDALEAFARLNRPGWRLVFAGDGPMRRQLELRAAELGVEHDVQFLGTHEDIPGLLAKSAIVVRPSLTEGRSLTILEAMASGVCVVASDIAANRELIRDGVTGVLTPVGDRIKLAHALRLLIDKPSKRSAIGSSARGDALRSSWDATARMTAEVLVGVAGGVPDQV
jgi:glycosyltransferase involved in cell wall biosynthesis